MICINCGETIRDKAEYCKFCGMSQKATENDLKNLSRLIRFSFICAVAGVIGGFMPMSYFAGKLLAAELLVCAATLCLCFFTRKQVISLFNSKKAVYKGKRLLKSAWVMGSLTSAAALFTAVSKMMG